MISPINVLRAVISSGVLEPVAASENLQIAVNNGDHLTLIEPKLPLLHQCLSNASKPDNNILNSGALFDIRSIFHIENLESLGFQIFSRILVEDKEQCFQFGRISEPSIVAHAWSPLESATMDCYLGILLNTGEVMALKRESLDASNYSVKFRSFLALLDQMQLPQERLTSEGDIILSGAQLLMLKVVDFVFGKAPAQGTLTICLFHENGSISIRALTRGQPLLYELSAGGIVAKLVWSQSALLLVYALLDNSVHYFKFDSAGSVHGPFLVKPSSRFLVSQLAVLPDGNILIADTASLHIGLASESLQSKALPYRSGIVSMTVIPTETATFVALPFESGQLCLAEISSGLSIVQSPSAWTSFISQILYRYQAQLLKEQARAPSKVFQPYFADTPEGNITIYGLSAFRSSGMLAITYTLAPRNVVGHTIKSKKEFTVAFLPIASLVPSWQLESITNLLSMTFLNSVFIADQTKFPSITKGVIDGQEESVSAFLKSIDDWKVSIMPQKVALPQIDASHESLQQSVVHNFRDNETVRLMQRRYLLNVSLLKTLTVISANSTVPLDELHKHSLQIAQEQDFISTKLREYLATLTLLWAKSQDRALLASEYDQYILKSFIQLLPAAEQKNFKLSVPTQTTLTISTDLCTEQFESFAGQTFKEMTFKYATSVSGHDWPRCDMTLLPILELSNKTDEMETHSYIAPVMHDSFILDVLTENLNFCIYSGLRSFNLKIGV